MPLPPSFCGGSGLYDYPGLHNSLFTCNSKAGKAGKNVSLIELSSMQLWNTDHGKQKAVQALNDSLKRCVELCQNVKVTEGVSGHVCFSAKERQLVQVAVSPYTCPTFVLSVAVSC